MNFGIFKKWKNCHIRRNIANAPIFVNGFIHGDEFCLLTSIENLSGIIQIGGTIKQALLQILNLRRVEKWVIVKVIIIFGTTKTIMARQLKDVLKPERNWIAGIFLAIQYLSSSFSTRLPLTARVSSLDGCNWGWNVASYFCLYQLSCFGVHHFGERRTCNVRG